MKLLPWIVLGWVVYRLYKEIFGRTTTRSAAPAPAAPRTQEAPTPLPMVYGFDPRRNWILALAHPVARLRAPQGFADPDYHDQTQALRGLRVLLLHLFSLRSDLGDAQIQQHLASNLPQNWFRIDLHNPQPSDNARDALAFACARVCFAVRLGEIMGWIAPELAWNILAQNAQRTQECFESWADYGSAWARGRRQWITHSRADSLGLAFDADTVQQWLTDPQHPWSQLPWKTPPLFDQPAIVRDQTPSLA